MPDNSNECCKELAGEAVEDSLLFFSKFPRMGDHGTAGAASGVLDVQHLVKQDILHGARRNAGTIHPTIEQNLIRPWIVTAKLPPPAPGAPSDVRALQLAGKVFSIELIEKSFQIEVFSAGSGGRQANPSAAHAIHAAARAAGTRVFQISLGERLGSLAAIHSRKQQRGRAFQDGQRRSSQ